MDLFLRLSLKDRILFIKQLSILINIDERPLFEEMEALKIAPQRLSAENFQKPDEEAEISRKDVIAQRIISLVLAKKELMDEMPKLKPYLPFQYQAASADTKNLINLASLRSSLMAANLDEKKIQDEFSALTKQLKREHFKEQRQLIGERIKKAEASNNETALQEALKEFDQVSKMMQNI